jgi:hypothetical protein
MKNPFALWSILALAVAITVGGCGPGETEPADESPVRVEGAPPPLVDSAGEHAGHLHPTEGLHGGHLYEVGNEQYYAEMLHDESTHKVTVHLLDSAAKQPVTTTEAEISLQLFREGQFVTYTLQAVGAGETGASQFEVVSEELCELMDHDKKVRGRMHVAIGGESFTVTIEHDPHEHDGHHQDGDGDGHDDDAHNHP